MSDATTVDRAAWLRKVCGPPNPIGLNSWAGRPWVLRLEGREWTAATNGKAAVYVAGVVEGAEIHSPFPHGAYQRQRLFAEKNLSRFFAPTAAALAHIEPVALPQLKAWCGEPDWFEPCATCDGYGEVYTAKGNTRECKACRGNGGAGGDCRPGLLCGVPVDRCLLAQFLAGVGGPDCCIHAAAPAEPLWLVADEWRVCAMAMGPYADSEEFRGAPRLGDRE